MSAYGYSRALEGFGWMVVLAALLLLIGVVADCGDIDAGPRRAHAQDTEAAPLDTAATTLVLAQAFVLEAGFDAATDHAAIAHLLRRKADKHEVDFQRLLIRYVAGFGVDTPRTRWVRALNLDATKPEGWPINLAWSAHAARWIECVQRAQAFLRGELSDPCRGKAEHFGGDMDNARAAHIGLVRVDCGATLNNFYARGSR